VHGARRFDQHADRNDARQAELRDAITHVGKEALDVGGAACLRQREKRNAVAGAVQQHVDLRLP
jgi:hypothetical protein